jgi:hypothetical protein
MLIDFLVPEYENPHEASGLSLNTHTAAIGMMEQTTNAVALHKLGIMSAIAIAIHNFPEGIATFIGALNDPQMGAGITFAISIHNIPEGIAVAIPIYYATKNKWKALLIATLSGFSEVIGALLCWAVTAIFGIELTGGGVAFPLILAAVAGIMIYISLDELLPRSFIPYVVERSGIAPDTKVNQITKAQRLELVSSIKAFGIKPVALGDIEGAVITAGGVSVKEIDPKTMESKLVPGLYFAGEVIDLDAETGGYNLQIAFATGYAAGTAI